MRSGAPEAEKILRIRCLRISAGKKASAAESTIKIIHVDGSPRRAADGLSQHLF
jgi:hypothetical protein